MSTTYHPRTTTTVVDPASLFVIRHLASEEMD
jgi:hypothetical protein